ncbi:MAG: ACP S-malonyltransferase [bacterium]|nr:ACP S-malonyltransferase [bacterium]
MNKLAFIFPGQGSQSVGMGKDFYDSSPTAREIFESANRILGWSLTDVCFSGPEEKLKQTEFAQPALFTVGYIAFQLLVDQGVHPAVVAGHSLGEYTALAAAAVLSFESALKLVAERGRLMQRAGTDNPGSMAAVLSLTESEVQEICRQAESAGTGYVGVANYNCPGQIVISGSVASVAKAIELISAQGKKAILLPVSGAFHSPLMESAARTLTELIHQSEFNPAKIPVVQNVTAEYTLDAETLQSNLTQQMLSPVRWEASVRKMIDNGITCFIEAGVGKVLSGMVKRIDREVMTLTVENIAGLNTAIQIIKENNLCS